MFSGIWSFIKRHRKKFIFAGVLVGGKHSDGLCKMLTDRLFMLLRGGVWLFLPFAGSPPGLFAPVSFAPWLVRPWLVRPLALLPPG